MFEEYNPNIKISDEAAEHLNDKLMEHFTMIASKAVQIVKKA